MAVQCLVSVTRLVARWLRHQGWRSSHGVSGFGGNKTTGQRNSEPLSRWGRSEPLQYSANLAGDCASAKGGGLLGIVQYENTKGKGIMQNLIMMEMDLPLSAYYVATGSYHDWLIGLG